MKKKRISITPNRQVTIPSEFLDNLDLSNEVDCIYIDGMLILVPVDSHKQAFSKEILTDLIVQGYTGEKLISEYKS